MKVWDLPTRIFHWLIVLVLCVSWFTAEQGLMEWHYLSGILGLALLAFRVIWGFLGSNTARFSGFVRAPAAVARYVTGAPDEPRPLGHNPLGGYSVVALLLVLGVQIGTGLFAVDVDGLESGPLSFFVSFEQGRVAAEIHEIAFTALQALVAVHVLAILIYRLRGIHLTRAMITGRSPLTDGYADGFKPAAPSWLVLALALAATLAWWIGTGAPGL